MPASRSARFSLDNDLAADFTAGNVFGFAINTTSSFIWVGGLVVLSLGFGILAMDSPRGPFRASSFVFGGALLADGVFDLVAPGPVLTVVYLGLAIAALYWIGRRATPSQRPQPERRQRGYPR